MEGKGGTGTEGERKREQERKQREREEVRKRNDKNEKNWMEGDKGMKEIRLDKRERITGQKLRQRKDRWREGQGDGRAR